MMMQFIHDTLFVLGCITFVALAVLGLLILKGEVRIYREYREHDDQ